MDTGHRIQAEAKLTQTIEKQKFLMNIQALRLLRHTLEDMRPEEPFSMVSETKDLFAIQCVIETGKAPPNKDSAALYLQSMQVVQDSLGLDNLRFDWLIQGDFAAHEPQDISREEAIAAISLLLDAGDDFHYGLKI